MSHKGPRAGIILICLALVYIILSSTGFGFPTDKALSAIGARGKEPQDVQDESIVWAELYQVNSLDASKGILELVLVHQSQGGAKDSLTLQGGEIVAFGTDFMISDLELRYAFGGPRTTYGALAPDDIVRVTIDLGGPIPQGNKEIWIKPAKGRMTYANITVSDIGPGYVTVWP